MVPAGGAAGGAAGGIVGGAQAPVQQRPTEANYSNDINWAKALNFHSFKAMAKGRKVFQIHVGKSFLKDFKNLEVLDLLTEFHIQYLFVMVSKIIPSGVISVEDYNGGLFNSNDAHYPFNLLKRYVILPVLSARHGGMFPAETLIDDIAAIQAAQNWLSNVVYDNSS